MLSQYIQRVVVGMLVGVLVATAAGIARAEQRPVDEGRIETIEIYRAADNKPVNAGTVIGGVAGGVIGHQIGNGHGNTAATIVGTLGGAVMGNEIEKKHTPSTRYRITVRLERGGSLILEETRDLNLRVGDRVRVEDGRIYRI